MKRILRITAEYVEEWDDNDTCEDMDKHWKDFTFDDWADADWDCVGRPLDRLIDEGWKITQKKLVKE